MHSLDFIDAYINKYDLYVNVEVYDDKYDWYNPFTYYDPDNNSPVIDLEKGTDEYEYDFTKLINRYDGEDKHLPVRVTLLENDSIITNKDSDEKIPLAKCYGFIDWNDDYKNANLVLLTMKETLRGIDTTEYGDNVFKNDKGHEAEHVNSLPTHRIIDFDNIVSKDFITKENTNKPWKDTKYAKEDRLKFVVEDKRTPLLLIHGWQGSDGQTFPSKLLRYENTEFEYWHNFISYYLATPKIYNKYKLYTYHYPSYKHITYNARMLKKLFTKVNKNSTLGQGINGDGIVIIGHSMGGLVARSFIEEHEGLGKNAEKLIKLITLDTPHHGSPSSISNYWRSQMGDIVKDFDTAGAVDLIWDNYDKKYTKDDSHFKATINPNNGDSRKVRLDEQDEYRGTFDYYYKYGHLNSVITSKDADISHWINPYLDSLNKKMKDNSNSFSKEKYIIYTALTPYSITDSKLFNPIDSDDAMILNTQLINGIGYAAGGAEPVCSSLLSFQTTIDNITRYTISANNLANIPPHKKFINISNDGDVNNNNIPYRIFWDYDHETIMNGQIAKGKSDKYIDEAISLNIKEIGKKTNFSDVDDSPLSYGTSRGEYIAFATDYLYYGRTNREVNENILIYESKDNPLKREPVFLVLQKDLLDALSLDNSIIDSHPLQDSTDFDIDDNITLTFLYPFDSSSTNKIITLENLDTSTEVTANIDFDSEGKILKINPDNNLTYANKYKLTYNIDGNLKNGKTSSLSGELIFTVVEEKAPSDVPLVGVSPDGNFNYNGGNFKLIVSPLDNNQELITDSLTKDNFSFSDIRITSKDDEDDIKSFGEANVTSINVTTYDKSNNVALIIVLDSSGSMSGNDPQRKRVEASKKLIDLVDENDTIAVIDFGAGTTNGKRVSRVLSDFTNDKTQLKNAIDNAVASGGTPLYESILDAEDMLASYSNKTKVIVVLTDGEANNNDNLDSSIQKAKDDSILIFPIGLGNNLDFNELEKLANETDGVFGKAEDANSLEEVYSSIGVGALKGKVSVFGKGIFKSPLTSEGEYKIFGKLKTDINKKSLETPFSFIINVEE